MEHPLGFALLGLGLGFGVALSTAAVAEAAHQTSTVSGKVVTTYQIHADSSDYRQIQDWVANATARSGQKVGNSANLFQKSIGDTFLVKVTRNVSGSSPGAMAASSPWMPTPWIPGGGYRIGDTATVSVTGGGWTQTWELRYEQTAQELVWVTIDYHATRVRVDHPPMGH